MKIRAIMSQDVVFCHLDTPLQEIAQAMIDRDCGAIPVVSDPVARLVVGIITDRDLAIRIIAQGMDPNGQTARACMSSPVVTLDIEASVEDAQQILERHQVRRIPIIDAATGTCCGIISQADIARYAPSSDTAALVKCLSQRIPDAARDLVGNEHEVLADGEPLWGS